MSLLELATDKQTLGEELAHLMGTSVAMIDRTYGHLARDSEDSIRGRLEARTHRSGADVASGGESDAGF